MDVDISVRIDRPPEAVYAMLADIQRYVDPASVVPQMEKIPAGPTAVGTRWREVVRLVPGLTMTIWTEVLAVEPDRRLEYRFHGPWMRGRLTYVIEPQDSGAELRQIETLTPYGPLGLVAGVVDRSLRPRLRQRLDDIRDLLERGETGRAEAASAAAPRRSLLRRVRWSLAIAAVVVELSAFVAWRLWLRRGPHMPAVRAGHSV